MVSWHEFAAKTGTAMHTLFIIIPTLASGLVSRSANSRAWGSAHG
jgi:hypothetical protein